MKRVAVATWIIVASTLAVAADRSTTKPEGAERGARDSQQISAAKTYWATHARGGSMSREDALKFKGPDGKGVDMGKLDPANRGKISEEEWTAYHLGATDTKK